MVHEKPRSGLALQPGMPVFAPVPAPSLARERDLVPPAPSFTPASAPPASASAPSPPAVPALSPVPPSSPVVPAPVVLPPAPGVMTVEGIRFPYFCQGILDEVFKQDSYRMREFLRPGHLFLDGGACFGDTALFAAKLGASKVVAYEPNPYVFEALSNNVRVNPRLASRITLRQKALAATNAPRKLCSPGLDNMGGGNLYGGGDVPVEAETLSTGLAWLLDGMDPNARRWLKLDVEGAEREILTDLAALQGFDFVTLEWHNFDGGYFRDLLQANGFDVRYLAGCDGAPYDATIARGLLFAVKRC